MQARTLLRTEDIRQMSIKEFLEFRRERCNAIPATEFQDANSDWLLISDLERVKDMKALRKLIGQLKEDLWWNIHHGRKSGGTDSE
jgi:hypothetical protein